jgi:hypothetical protein
MKKISVLATCLTLACVMLTSSAYSADEKSKIAVAKAEAKAAVSETASKPAPRAMKVRASEARAHDYSLERDACCFTR